MQTLCMYPRLTLPTITLRHCYTDVSEKDAEENDCGEAALPHLWEWKTYCNSIVTASACNTQLWVRERCVLTLSPKEATRNNLRVEKFIV